MKSIEQLLEEWTPVKVKEFLIEKGKHKQWEVMDSRSWVLATYLQDEGYDDVSVGMFALGRFEPECVVYTIPDWYAFFLYPYSDYSLVDTEVLLMRLEGYMEETRGEKEGWMN